MKASAAACLPDMTPDIGMALMREPESNWNKIGGQLEAMDTKGNAVKWVIPLCALIAIGCCASSTPPPVQTSPSAPNPIQSVSQPPAIDPQQAAKEARYRVFVSGRDAILRQTEQNETSNSVIRSEISIAEMTLKELEYSGKRMEESDWDTLRTKQDALVRNLEDRLRLDSQLKSFYSQYPEFAGR